MMPKRRRTRAQDRAQRIAAERRRNREARLARREERLSYFNLPHPTTTTTTHHRFSCDSTRFELHHTTW
ncbi:hypothetical protein I552_1811 [Mycobacterium xenopi 3993]|nr:hypothetical protein I552_1811 [Mycobacterium xenopi 3993]